MTLDSSNVREGDELPVLHIEPSLGMVIRYCALQWTFPVFFYDPEAARSMGFLNGLDRMCCHADYWFKFV